MLITEPFQSVVASHAVRYGAPGYHSLVVPHPVWGSEPQRLRELARRVAGAAIAQLAP